MKAYRPQPADARGIRLPDDLLNVVELLAENVHETWALQRQNDGWIYGPRRDDEKKEHPGLVPYSELTESEKEYDRKTALETIKFIIKSGYTLMKNPSIGGSGVETVGEK